MSIKIQPYFAEGEKFPALIGVRAEGDEHETAYVSKSELVDALAENTKLRELVRDMMQAWWACDNEMCPRHDERCEKGKYCAFDECAQELGIEVD